MPDQDGSPTEEELARIRAWPADDPIGWFAYIKTCWCYTEWGWKEFDGVDDFGRPLRMFHLSTAGWSGNEEILSEMRQNGVPLGLWAMTWYSHRRGGHYTFRVEKGEP